MRILSMISEGKGLNAHKMGNELLTSESHTTKVIHVLEAKGLITRKKKNGREKKIILTDKGTLLASHCQKIVEADL